MGMKIIEYGSLCRFVKVGYSHQQEKGRQDVARDGIQAPIRGEGQTRDRGKDAERTTWWISRRPSAKTCRFTRKDQVTQTCRSQISGIGYH